MMKSSKYLFLATLPIFSTTIFAGYVQLKTPLPSNVKNITLYTKQALSPFGGGIYGMCIWNDKYQAYFDPGHLPTASSYDPCVISETSWNWNSYMIERANDDLKFTGQTYSLVEVAVTKINGQPAPKSCTQLAGYNYRSNNDYVISISHNGCVLEVG